MGPAPRKKHDASKTQPYPKKKPVNSNDSESLEQEGNSSRQGLQTNSDGFGAFDPDLYGDDDLERDSEAEWDDSNDDNSVGGYDEDGEDQEQELAADTAPPLTFQPYGFGDYPPLPESSQAVHVPKNGERWMNSHGKFVGADSVPRALNNMHKHQMKVEANDNPDPNGRFIGRRLVMWHRPRMMEKLVLNMQYECHKKGYKIPWDDIVHRLSPGCSGPSAVQMLNKLRDVLIMEGHIIPPILGKPKQWVDPTLRGYCRDMTSDIPTTTRAVRWSERTEDRKTNLDVPGMYLGSGNYRKLDGPREWLKREKVSQRRCRVPKEVVDLHHAIRAGTASKTDPRIPVPCRGAGAATSAPPRLKRRYTRRNVPSEDEEDVDPAELNADDDYDPSKKRKPRRGELKSSGRKRNSTQAEMFETPTKKPRSARHSQSTAPKKGSSFVVTLHADPQELAQYPVGIEPQTVRTQPMEDPFVSQPQDQQSLQAENLQVRRQNSTQSGMVQNTAVPTAPAVPAATQIGGAPRQTSYAGVMEHGTLEQFSEAVRDGRDPRVNGILWKNLGQNFEGEHDDEDGEDVDENEWEDDEDDQAEVIGAHNQHHNSQGMYVGNHHGYQKYSSQGSAGPHTPSSQSIQYQQPQSGMSTAGMYNRFGQMDLTTPIRQPDFAPTHTPNTAPAQMNYGNQQTGAVNLGNSNGQGYGMNQGQNMNQHQGYTQNQGQSRVMNQGQTMNHQQAQTQNQGQNMAMNRNGDEDLTPEEAMNLDATDFEEYFGIEEHEQGSDGGFGDYRDIHNDDPESAEDEEEYDDPSPRPRRPAVQHGFTGPVPGHMPEDVENFEPNEQDFEPTPSPEPASYGFGDYPPSIF